MHSLGPGAPGSPFVIMALVLLEPHHSHDHEINLAGVSSALPSASTTDWPACPAMGGARPSDGGPGSGAVIEDHAADVLAVEQVLVSLVDLIEGVRRGDQLVQLQVTGPVELYHPRDIVERVAGTEQAPLDA